MSRFAQENYAQIYMAHHTLFIYPYLPYILLLANHFKRELDTNMQNTHRTKVLIIGAGPAGYTAAIYAARAGLKPILVTGLQPGGQLTITDEIENYPGFATPVQGPWLMEQMREQAQHVGTQLIYDLISQASLKKDVILKDISI